MTEIVFTILNSVTTTSIHEIVAVTLKLRTIVRLGPNRRESVNSKFTVFISTVCDISLPTLHVDCTCALYPIYLHTVCTMYMCNVSNISPQCMFMYMFTLSLNYSSADKRWNIDSYRRRTVSI